MKSVSELLKELKTLKTKLVEAKDQIQQDSEVQAAQIAMRAADDRLREAIYKARRKFVYPIQDDIDRVEKELVEAEKAKIIAVPSHIKELVDNFMRGVHYGPKGLMVDWVSPEARFFIIKQPGHTFWANMMEPNKYTPTKYYLVDSQVKAQNVGHGALSWFGAATLESHEGRLTKEIRQKWQEIIKEKLK